MYAKKKYVCRLSNISGRYRSYDRIVIGERGALSRTRPPDIVTAKTSPRCSGVSASSDTCAPLRRLAETISGYIIARRNFTNTPPAYRPSLDALPFRVSLRDTPDGWQCAACLFSRPWAGYVLASAAPPAAALSLPLRPQPAPLPAARMRTREPLPCVSRSR